LKPTLCTDVDSTIWNTGPWVCSAVLDITGEVLDTDTITTWTHVLDNYGEHTRLLPLARSPQLPPYKVHNRHLLEAICPTTRELTS
jgi:hypothetical protein